MATIGTFMKDGEGFVGIISTRTVQARVVLVPDRTALPDIAFTAMIGMSEVGQAVPATLPDGATGYRVTLHPSVLPGTGQAWLQAMDGYFVLVV